MSYSNVPAGKDVPNDIYVIIEIPANAKTVDLSELQSIDELPAPTATGGMQ